MINFRDFLAYNPATGLLAWVAGNPCLVGKTAGSTSNRGYVTVEIKGVRYRAHLIAFWFISGRWLPGKVDHADRVRDNNRQTNLREANATQQIANRKVSSRNKTGLKGAMQQSPGSYRSTITVAGTRRLLGSFPSAEQAHARYLEEAEKCFGLFACAG